MSRQKCAHCGGTGTASWHCCNMKELGKAGGWSGNAHVKCCACGGSGYEGGPGAELLGR